MCNGVQYCHCTTKSGLNSVVNINRRIYILPVNLTPFTIVCCLHILVLINVKLKLIFDCTCITDPIPAKYGQSVSLQKAKSLPTEEAALLSPRMSKLKKKTR